MGFQQENDDDIYALGWVVIFFLVALVSIVGGFIAYFIARSLP